MREANPRKINLEFLMKILNMREGLDFVLFDIVRFLCAIIYIAICDMIRPPAGSFISRRVHVQCRYLCYHRREQGMQGRNFIDSNECLCIYTVGSGAFMQYRKLNFYVLFIERHICCISTSSPEDPKYFKNSYIEKYKKTYIFISI